MEVLFRCSNINNTIEFKSQSIRDLKILALYQKKFLSDNQIFKHYLQIIGYSGGVCQEECSFVINGSDFDNSRISIAHSIFPTFWEKEYFKNELIDVSYELHKFDVTVFNEFQKIITQYVIYAKEKNALF